MTARRARGTGSIRHVRAGVWRVQAPTAPQVDGARGRRDVTVRGSRGDAERTLARLLADTTPPDARVTVAEYITGWWLPHVQARVRVRTFTGYRSIMDVHVLPHLGHVPLAQITPLVLDRWLDSISPGLSARSVHNVVAVVRNALRQAVRWRLIDRDPLDAVTVPSPPRRDPTTLDAAQARQAIAAAPGTDAAAIVALCLGAGLRRSEACGVTWRDIDLAAGTVQVERGVHQEGSAVWVEPPKTATSRRTVHLPAWAVDALRGPVRGLGYVLGESGALPRPDAVSARWRAFRDGLPGLPPVPLRDLRHTHATLALASGTDLLVVSRRLGHSTVAVTDVYYLRPGADLDEAAARRLDDLGTGPR